MDEGITKELIFSDYHERAPHAETEGERIKDENISDNEEPATKRKEIFHADGVRIEYSLPNVESQNGGGLLEVYVHEESMEEKTFCDEKTTFASVESNVNRKSKNKETISYYDESVSYEDIFLGGVSQVQDPLGNYGFETSSDLVNKGLKPELNVEVNDPMFRIIQEQIHNESVTQGIKDEPLLSDPTSPQSSSPAHALQGMEYLKWIHIEKKSFECELCGHRFTLLGSLKNHQAVHSGEKPFGCDVCGRKFALKKFLQSHQAIHNKGKPFQCDVCSRKFLYRRSWKNHQMVHTGEKPFQCDLPECGKKFSLKKSLVDHQAAHDGLRPFQCDVCGRTFSLRGSLRTHLAVHTGKKPFQCDLCGRTFSQLSILKDHQTVHSEEKPFQCAECDRRFPRKRALRKHVKIHFREKPFQCQECQQRFLHKSDLEKHQSEHERETDPV